ncbi:MAG: Na(+)-translocating NADH:ubiquinone reductase subunit C, partial [Bacteroidaceae bacterium]|nr:Na(+)-translocating NADH:ubiquinone reductase subunit C [Bacteroidaceae bacterium]
MAKYKCKVCGHVHEGTEAPDKCPVCQQPKDSFELIEADDVAQTATAKKKGLDTNSNVYTIIYAAVMVIIVAFLLAFVASAL